MARVNWYGDKIIKEMEDEEIRRLTKAAMFLENEIKKKLGQKCPPHSNPGDYPALESGELRRSITHEVDKKELRARVGTNKIYGKYLEEGTTRMDPRPFIKNTLADNRGAITDILSSKKRG